ncbi:MAG: class I SAM-dependent methyltransferase [Gammaproteobacteria bacterium]|nr:class I SAM-dependent methyltransferase [Gammaproteobacteria bacterium]
MFKDHFSRHADAYAGHRPDYPAALFDYLATGAGAREVAWDVATGNGQAALALARHFAQVWATDASAEQIRAATPHQRVAYGVAPAETSGLESASVDLITVAQALHWLDLPRFYAEVLRVLRPGGVIAVWCYHLISVSPEVDRVLAHFYADTIGADWPPERRLVEDGYRSLEFPFAEIQDAPAFSIERLWSVEQVLNYVSTWSAVQRYQRRLGVDPVEAHLAPALRGTWGDRNRQRQVGWPILLRLGIHRPA